MSAHFHSYSNPIVNQPGTAYIPPDVLGELLHSLSQPLTTLRCSLELSIDEADERQQQSVTVALQQTEKVIGMVQLMREYLEAAQPAPEVHSAALAPAVRSVIEQLSSVAAVRDVQLRLVGTCTAVLPVPELRLRLALQYLIAAMIEGVSREGKIVLLLGEGPAGAVLRAESISDSGTRGAAFYGLKPAAAQVRGDSARAALNAVSGLRRVRLSIASRVLEAAGASLVYGSGFGLGDGNGDDVRDAGGDARGAGEHGAHFSGFVLRFPRPISAHG